MSKKITPAKFLSLLKDMRDAQRYGRLGAETGKGNKLAEPEWKTLKNAFGNLEHVGEYWNALRNIWDNYTAKQQAGIENKLKTQYYKPGGINEFVEGKANFTVKTGPEPKAPRAPRAPKTRSLKVPKDSSGDRPRRILPAFVQEHAKTVAKAAKSPKKKKPKAPKAPKEPKAPKAPKVSKVKAPKEGKVSKAQLDELSEIKKGYLTNLAKIKGKLKDYPVDSSEHKMIQKAIELAEGNVLSYAAFDESQVQPLPRVTAKQKGISLPVQKPSNKMPETAVTAPPVPLKKYDVGRLSGIYGASKLRAQVKQKQDLNAPGSPSVSPPYAQLPTPPPQQISSLPSPPKKITFNLKPKVVKPKQQPAAIFLKGNGKGNGKKKLYMPSPVVPPAPKIKPVPSPVVRVASPPLVRVKPKFTNKYVIKDKDKKKKKKKKVVPFHPRSPKFFDEWSPPKTLVEHPKGILSRGGKRYLMAPGNYKKESPSPSPYYAPTTLVEHPKGILTRGGKRYLMAPGNYTDFA